MFEDIIDSSTPSNPQKAKQIHWDFKQYEKQAYCYSCGSSNVRVMHDKLYGDRLENDMMCLYCGAEWREIWDAGINLDLKELKIGCLKI
jgi:hypothetical protein